MLMKEAKLGKITPEMKAVAEYEKVSVDFIRRHLAEGQIIIVSNVKRRDKLRRFVGVGTGLFTKVNANIGTSRSFHRRTHKSCRRERRIPSKLLYQLQILTVFH